MTLPMMQWGDRFAAFRARDRGPRAQQRLVLRTLQDRNPNTRTREFFLREIDVAFEIQNFAPGETLDELLFDGIDVTPAGSLVADGSGQINGTFRIPANVPTGSKIVVATGDGGSNATSTFTGSVVVQQIPAPPVTAPPGNRDPVAQTFTLDESRWVTSIDVAFRAKGSAANAVRIQIRATVTGEPSGSALAEGRVPGTFSTSGWTNIPLDRPLWCQAGVEYSFTLLTDDLQHRVGLAELGQYDTIAQQWVTAQPYGVGVLQKSSNNSTWTAFQTQDLMFRIKAAKFTANTRTVDLGPIYRIQATSLTQSGGVATLTAAGHGFSAGDTVLISGAGQAGFNGPVEINSAVENSFQFTVDAGLPATATGTIYVAPGLTSDLAVRASLNRPTPNTGVQFRYITSDPAGTEYGCAPNEKLELESRIEHGLRLEMDLVGNEKESPYVFEGVTPVTAALIEEANYISRAIPCVETDRIEVNYDAYVPSGASVEVNMQLGAPGAPTWSSGIAVAGVEDLGDGWGDYNHSIDPFTGGGTETRVQLKLTGTPASRPALNELRLAALFAA